MHDGVIWKVTWSPDSKSLLSASDDRTARLWYIPEGFPEEDKIINPAQIFFGHSARVWDCAFYESNYIVTASEDTTCILWDIKTGKILDTFIGHEGRSVWSISIIDNILVSGGSDSTIRLWDLMKCMSRGNLEAFDYTTILDDKDNIKAICLATDNDIPFAYISTGKGRIFRMDLSSGSYTLLYSQKCSWSCTSLLDYDVMAACDIEGSIHFLGGLFDVPYILNVRSSRITMISPAPIPKHIQVNKDSTFIGFFYASADSTSEWWVVEISDNNINTFKIATFEGKNKGPSKRAPSAIWSVCFDIDLNVLLAGDSFGNIMIYDISAVCEQDLKLEPIYCKSHVHGRERVTSIVIDSSNKDILTSGRDGIVNTFKMVQSLEERYSLNLINSEHFNKSFNSIGQIIKSDEQIFILGFSTHTTLCNWPDVVNANLVIMGHNGKTPYDILVSTNENRQNYYYVYGKSGKIHVHALNNQKPLFSKRLLTVPFHGRESNSVEFLNYNNINKDPNEHLFITTSEDTTVRSYAYNEKTKEVRMIQTLNEHICATRSTYSSEVNGKIIMFSAGGKLIMKGWKLDNNSLRFSLLEKMGYDCGSDQDSTCRIMDISCTPLSECELILALARSDRKISCYIFNSQTEALDSCDSISCFTVTCLSTQVVKIGEKPGHFLFSGDTKGNISVWDLSKCMRKEQKAIYEDPEFRKRVHQFSVDSVDTYLLSTSEVLLASGGHDQRLYVSLFQFSLEHNQYNPHERSSIALDNIHNAAITCVKIQYPFIFTSGPDQRVCVWKCSISSDSIIVDAYCSLLVEICDISSIDIKCVSDNEYIVILVGKGLQIVHFNA